MRSVLPTRKRESQSILSTQLLFATVQVSMEVLRP
jgi:hypothetical protein